MSRAKRPTRRRPTAVSKSRPPTRTRRRPPASEVEAFEDVVDAEVLAPSPSPLVLIEEHEPEVPLATPEPGIAARVPPPAPERSHPDRRRAIFFDVENTSRAEHIARVIEHLAVDRTASRTDFIAVGNWRVIGHDTARLLAKHGAQLVHSAPSVGVRDWSDLRIAVAAGVWLAAARAGDVIELVSDDRAFDAVGDVAASLGITFRRLSFRRLVGQSTVEAVAEAPAPVVTAARDSRGGRGRRRGRRGGRSHAPAAPMLAPQPPPSLPHATVATNGEPAVEPHTAPHDEIVGLVSELIGRAGDGSVSIDTLANALKSRGFRRPPGSPRLITRLRRIREITIDRGGRITLVNGAAAPHHPVAPLHDEPTEPDGNRVVPPPTTDVPEDEPTPGNELTGGPGRVPPGEAPPAEVSAERRRRRSRRGGRGRHRGRSGAPAAP